MVHTLQYRVPYADVDRMGIVYYGHYLTYFERGRTELLRACGLPYAELEDQGILLPVIEAHCEYLKPARYDDLLLITTTTAGRTGIRILMQCQVSRDDSLLVRGYTRHVATTPEGRPCRLPTALLALFPEMP
jgi:acyl-CoA thioester hydrolase